MSIYFTSDTHFGHSNILIFCNRPWLQEGDVEHDETGRLRFVHKDIADLRVREMDEGLIAKWNAKVSPQDTVYHLGDICFYRKEEQIRGILDRLNGKICLIRGNHDNEVLDIYPERFEWVRSIHTVKHDKKRIECCHYPMISWNQRERGAYHLYGHCHGTLPEDPEAYSFDIGADVNNLEPVSVEQVFERMEKKSKNVKLSTRGR